MPRCRAAASNEALLSSEGARIIRRQAMRMLSTSACWAPTSRMDHTGHSQASERYTVDQQRIQHYEADPYDEHGSQTLHTSAASVDLEYGSFGVLQRHVSITVMLTLRLESLVVRRPSSRQCPQRWLSPQRPPRSRPCSWRSSHCPSAPNAASLIDNTAVLLGPTKKSTSVYTILVRISG